MRMLQELKLLQPKSTPVDEFFRGVVPIDITSIYRWVVYENDKKVWEFKDFPALVVPFGACWMESQLPFHLDRDVRRLAVRALSLENEPGEETEVLEEKLLYEIVQMTAGWEYNDKIIPGGHQELLNASVDRGDCCRFMTLLELYYDDRVVGPLRVCVQGFWLDEYGRCLDLPSVVVPTREIVGMSEEWSHEEFEALTNDWTAATLSFLVALSLLHCKNVSLEDLPGPPPAVAKKRAKKGIPDIKFKTLVIEPMRQQIKREQAEDGEPTNEIQRALHICRGHFKDYREHPLFGKYADIFWWEPHVRGSIKQGMVIKDYKVKAPNERNNHSPTGV